MEEKKRKSKFNISYIFYIFCAVTVLIVLAAFFLDEKNYSEFIHDNCEEFNKGWTYSDNSGNTKSVTLPCKIENAGAHVKLFAELEDILKRYGSSTVSMAIRTSHQNVKVYIDGKLVDEFSNNKNTLFTKTPGNVWLFVDVPSDSKQITLEYDNVYQKDYGDIKDIYIGKANDIVLKLIKKSAVGIVVSILMFGLSGVLYLFWFFIKSADTNKKLLFISIFTFVLSGWSLLECDIMQFFVSNQEVLNLTSYELLMLMAIPILFCVKEELEESPNVKIINGAMLISIVNFIACNVLQIFGIADLAETVFMTHFTFVIAMITGIFASSGKILTRKRKSDKLKFNWTKLAIIILCLSALMDIVNYYKQIYEDGATFSRIGIFFFVTVLGISTLSEIYEMNIITEKLDIWDQFAHQDILTNTNNRVAFEEELQDVKKNQTPDDKVAVISFDINNLKTINDSYGHSAGDEYLIECITAINDVIGEEAKLYRTGGDEFVVLVRPYGRGQVMKYITAFETILRNENNGYKYPISFAYGYSYFKPQLDTDIYDTLKRADKDMYDKKVEMKKNGADVRL